MTIVPNLLLTSEWLFPMLKRQLSELHKRLAHESSIDMLIEVAAEYQQVFEELKVAELADFTNLAYLLEMMTGAMADEVLSLDYIDQTIKSSELLLQELNHYVKIGTYEESELVDCCQQLHDLLAAKNIRLDLQPKQPHMPKVDEQNNVEYKAQNSQINSDAISEKSLPQVKDNASKVDSEDFLIHDDLTDSELDDLERQFNPDYTANSNPGNNSALESPVKDVVDVEFDIIDASEEQEGQIEGKKDNNPSEVQAGSDQTERHDSQSTNQTEEKVEIENNASNDNNHEPVNAIDSRENHLQIIQQVIDTLDIPRDAEDSDPEIKPIFVEEAFEVLEEISEAYQQHDNAVDIVEVISEVRRGFHTLKGSGRMVGAHTTSELAWAVEDMLNRVLDDSIKLTSGIKQLVNDVIETYPQFIDIFEREGDYPEQLKVYIACAQIYAKKLDNSFDYSQFAKSISPDQTLQSDQQTSLDSVVEAANVKAPAAEMLLEEMTTANERLKEAATATVAIPRDSEAELQHLFAEEASELLADIEAILLKSHTQPTIMVEDKMVRAFHTLRGAASSQSLTAISDISATVEHSLEQLQQQDEPMTEGHLEAISQSVELIKAYIHKHQAMSPTLQMQEDIDKLHDAFDSSRGEDTDNDTPFNVADLIDDTINDLLDAQWELKQELRQINEIEVVAYAEKLETQCQLLLSRVQGSPKFVTLITALAGVYQKIMAKPELSKRDDVVNALIEGHDQLTGLLDSLAGSMALKLDSDVVTRLDSLMIDDSLQAATDYSIDKNTTITLEVSDKDATALEIEEVEYDAELLQVFLEELRDIDSDISEQLTLWMKQPESTGPIRVLLRHLHTIKGGARMAGISSIAELMHEAETLYEYFLEDKIAPNQAWIAVMQSVQDTLANQVDFLSTQGKSFFVPEFISQLHELSQTKQIPTGYRLRLPVAPSYDVGDINNTYQSSTSLNNDYLYNESNNNAAGDTTDAEQPSGQSLQPVRSIAETEDIYLASENLLDDPSYFTNNPLREQSADRSSEVDSIELEFDRLKSESWEGESPDPDILDIFLEEAEEVLASIEKNFQEFQRDIHEEIGDSNLISEPTSSALQNLPRELHNLKGGARMVHANGVAEVTHHLEMVYVELIKHQQINPSAYQLLTLSHEWLDQAIYLIKHGINPPSADALITKLNEFRHHPDDLQSLPEASLQDYVQAVSRYEKWRDARLGLRDISKMPEYLASAATTDKQPVLNSEMIRVPSVLMEQIIDLSGESTIHRSRIELSIGSLGQNIDEMETTVQRLAEQLRRMEIELEAQVRSQINEDYLKTDAGFDPLEMDEYSVFNQLSKSLSESASDLLDIKTTLRDKTRDTETLLLQLSQTQAELQDGLMTTRMMPFSHLSPRLQRTVRQTASELGKSVELVILNEQDEVDRTVLDRITSPLEHMLRNSVDHGIESPEMRQKSGKSSTGQIVIDINREGSEIVISVSDDGKGIDVNSVRRKAISRGLINNDDTLLTDLEVMQYIFHPGLSTANSLTQISGRGVGMDVVLSEVRQLGGTVSVQSQEGQGTQFVLRLPLTIAISDALVIRAGNQKFAVPLIQIERIERISSQGLLEHYQSDSKSIEIAGVDYRLQYLNEMLTGVQLNELSVNSNISLPVIILKTQAGQKLALQVDEIVGSRIEAVVKPLGSPLANIIGFSAATITGEGTVMLILDALELMRNAPQLKLGYGEVNKKQIAKRLSPQVLIVDDSVTVRKVTSRILERQGYKTFAARDGVEALEMLQSLRPDLMLLDIEMPRMDGFEIASHVRHDPVLKDLPIIMITSRTGDKHRQRALQLGVNAYLGKPFQEAVLMSTIQGLIKQSSAVHSG